jgi:uncharacterized Zn-binding protein involved in type VI secretion
MANTARLTDTLSHGGYIMGSSPDRQANGLGVARIGDNAMCNQHGMVTIVGGSQGVLTNGLATARIGDMLSCGAVIVSGSPDVDTGDTGPSVAGNPPPLQQFPAPDGGAPIPLYERDMGNEYDDPPSNRTGLSIYPQILNRDATPQEVARNNALVGTAPAPTPSIVVTSAANTPTTPGVPVDASGITSPLPNDMQLSPNFKLSEVSWGTPQSKKAIVAQWGLTDVQIAVNLKTLCMNVLEPLVAQYGRSELIITSAWRIAGSSNTSRGHSQHEDGCAADIQFTSQYRNLSSDDWWARVMWIKDNIQYDQMIVEYVGHKPWVHLSYTTTQIRKQLLTAVTSGGKTTYPQGLQKLI